MPKKNKLFVLMISEILFLFFMFVILPSFLIKERPGTQQLSYSDVLSLDIKNSYNQEFIANQDNLELISVLLKNPGVINKSQIEIETQNQNKTVKIELQDQNKNTLNSFETKWSSVGDPSWVNVEFPNSNYKNGDKFFINVSTTNQLPDRFFIYGDVNSKSINFRTTYQSSNLINSLKLNLNQQINNFKSRNIFYNISYFFIILLINIFIVF